MLNKCCSIIISFNMSIKQSYIRKRKVGNRQPNPAPPKNKMSRVNGLIYVLMYGAYMTMLFLG